jgi:hypothetical protein
MQFISRDQFRQYIQSFDFPMLFNRLGWNYVDETHPVSAGTSTFNLHTVAEKSGFRIVICGPDDEGKIPPYALRIKIHKAVSRLFKEHLVIFTDEEKTQQLWQVAVSEPTRITETRWFKGQDPELLFQKASGLFFTLEDEDKITIVDVTGKINANFSQNAEKVTRKFYDGFKKEHILFTSFTKGIAERVNREWYASLMMNRLMFCYFIQKKYFLDNNLHYLREKLEICQKKKGKNKFYSFYRNFLKVLFYEGLGSPVHGSELREEIGEVPYLNGGLFDEHELEKKYNDIDIDDKAFASLFDFFDRFRWHIDTRADATGDEINPDVIGYIFEKYINDRAEMGAYYTKEDITGYISRNCIIPFLFDKVQSSYPAPFEKSGEIWSRLLESGDKYIYYSVKHGAGLELPAEISKGMNDFEKREEWNKSAPGKWALPGEIWREVVERRTKYSDTLKKISGGEIGNINDLITQNLDIFRFAQDTLQYTEDAELIHRFYQNLESITIIDPACGSGAFLFAALNILEPLYEICLMRMRAFVDDEDRLNGTDKKIFNNSYPHFREILRDIENSHHPDRTYFIYKTIILRNLYGVDIMIEATEIAKLRLFLKLVARVRPDYSKPNLGLEPLPDIDFNIRHGNTLVGFASQDELKNALSTDIELAEHEEEIMNECHVVAMTYDTFKYVQLTPGHDRSDLKQQKEILFSRLNKLNSILNPVFAKKFGVNSVNATIEISEEKDGKKKKVKVNHFNWWRKTYQPFHWFAEFYDIIRNGGFDVVIGNPPYVEYSKIPYKLDYFSTLKCGNLYAFVSERALNIAARNSRYGMIVPVSSICTDRMIPYQRILLNKTVWNSLFGERPSKLFTGAEVQLAITIIANQGSREIFSTMYNKWPSVYRDDLFENVSYTGIREYIRPGSFPKIGKQVEKNILSKMVLQRSTLNHIKISGGEHFVSYRNAGGRYYKVILNYEPKFTTNGEEKRSSTYQFMYFNDKETADAVCALMNSSLFFWYWLIFSDTWHMVNREIGSFPIEMNNALRSKLAELNTKLMEDLKKHSVIKTELRNKGKDVIEFTQFSVRESKHIIDEIDKALGEHYGFTREELDYIINYDIKYRMSKEEEE